MLIADGDVPEGKDWVYQIKWDGVRCILYIENGHVTLQNRAGNDITACFPEIVKAFENKGFGNSIIDGEIIVLNEKKRPAFSLANMRAQTAAPIKVRLMQGRYPAVFIPFDTLMKDGESLLNKPFGVRASHLDGWSIPGVSMVPPIYEDLPTIQGVVASHAHEGFVARNLNGKYQEGERPKSNIRWKDIRTLDVIITGWEKGNGIRYQNFGSFRCRVLDDQYTGLMVDVSSGLPDAVLKDLIDSLETISEDENNVVVREEIVIEINYLEVEETGLIRNPSFSRIRLDKVAL